MKACRSTYTNASTHFDQHVALIRQNFVQKFAKDEEENSDDHQHGRNAEGEREAVVHAETLHVLAQDGCD
jgi:hypothetical protein